MACRVTKIATTPTKLSRRRGGVGCGDRLWRPQYQRAGGGADGPFACGLRPCRCKGQRRFFWNVAVAGMTAGDVVKANPRANPAQSDLRWPQFVLWLQPQSQWGRKGYPDAGVVGVGCSGSVCVALRRSISIPKPASICGEFQHQKWVYPLGVTAGAGQTDIETLHGLVTAIGL